MLSNAGLMSRCYLKAKTPWCAVRLSLSSQAHACFEELIKKHGRLNVL